MKIKKMMAAMMTAVCLVGMIPGTAFANYDAAAAEAAEDVQNEKGVEAAENAETEAEEDAEPEITAMEPLTPEGNLTLVDDAGSPADVGKQFITLVTKNGNYFYLIIDRDAKGEETVHFLNQVDEADLLALMEEDEVKAYEEEKQPEQADEVPETPAERPVEEPQEPVEKGKSPVLPLLSLVVLLTGGGAYAFLTWKEKKKQEQAEKPDPDADYREDEEEYLMAEEEENEE